MSANYCEARHKWTGRPDTHCFHPTGKYEKRYRPRGHAVPVESCCWCGFRCCGEPVPKKHGPMLPAAPAKRGRS